MRLIFFSTFLLLLVQQNQYGQSQCPDYSREEIEAIKSELDLFQKDLISRGYLQDSSASSFFKFYRENIPNVFESFERKDWPLIDSEFENLIHKGCQVLIESKEEASRLYEYLLRIKPKLDSALKTMQSNVDPNILGEVTANELTITDVKNSAIKNRLLLSAYKMITSENATAFSFLPKFDSIPADQSRQQIIITLDAQDKILVQDKFLEFQTLKETINSYLSQYKDELTISLRTAKGASYEIFVNMLDAINSIYLEHHNEIAKRRFGKLLEDCSAEEKEIVYSELKKRVVITSFD